MDVEAVAAIIHEVAVEVVLPRWRTLDAGDVVEKSPGELVSIADQEAERTLTRELQALLPGSVVVGEEAATDNPGLLAAVDSAPVVWLVDPIDGTTNFVEGSPDFALMVALLRAGESIAAWIERPVGGETYWAEKGSGAFAGDRRMRRRPQPRGLESLRGAALSRLLDDRQRRAVNRLGEMVGSLGPGRVCAGIDYPLIAEGRQDFVLFMRSLPWDHAPGALILTEAGGCVSHLDGDPYRPGQPRQGLLASSDPGTHADLLDALERCGYAAPLPSRPTLLAEQDPV